MKSVGSSIADTAAAAGLGLWVRNIFVPMYGQHDVWGRIVSFIIRLANIVVRSMWVSLWALLCVVVVAAWIAAPLFVVYLLVTTLTGATQ